MRNAAQELVAAIRDPSVDRLPRAILDVGNTDDARLTIQLRDAIRTLTTLRKFTDPAEFAFKDISDLYLESLGGRRIVSEALNYLRLYQAMATELRQVKGDWHAGWLSTFETAARLRRAVERLPGLNSDMASSRLVLGKLGALHDRDESARLFATLTDDDLDLFQPDVGARTYLADPSPEHEAPPLEFHGFYECSTVLLFSVDAQFLRTFLPYWVSVAPYIHAAHLHFIVTEPDALDGAKGLVSSASDLRGCYPNVSFSTVDRPDWCPNPGTFSACARYLYARQVMQHFNSRVIVLDADFYLTDDPTPWLSALPTHVPTINSNMCWWSLDPWRKFLGGTFSASNNAAGVAALNTIESYILAGLTEHKSWFLDQNALGYAFEKLERGAFESLSRVGVRRPVRELPLLRTMERATLRQPGATPWR